MDYCRFGTTTPTKAYPGCDNLSWEPFLRRPPPAGGKKQPSSSGAFLLEKSK